MSTLPQARLLDRATPPHILTLILLAGLPALSMSIFLPSLAIMAEEFGTEYGVMQIAVAGYLGAVAVLQVFIGPLADRFGRRPVVLVALGVFCLATLGTLLAQSIEVFLTFRMVQAVVATGMVLSRAIVRDMVPEAEAASMIGYVTMGMALVPMIGPVIGGTLDDVFGWRATFLFLLLCGGLVWVLCWRDLGETVAGKGMRFSDQVKGYPELLTSPRFWGYVACMAFSSGAFFAFLGGASFVAQNVHGLSAFWTGMAVGSPAVGYAAGNYVSGRFSVRAGINRMILVGAIVVAIGMGLSLALGLAGIGSALLFFGFCTFLGFGNGMVLPSANAGSLSVRPHLAGTASGLGGAIMIGGGAALSALAGVLLTGAESALPLQWLMFLTSLFAILSILLVIRREARLR